MVRDSKRLSLDYQATVADRDFLRRIYSAREDIDLALLQFQRDMARPSSSEDTASSLNHMFLAFSQIQERFQTLYKQAEQEITRDE